MKSSNHTLPVWPGYIAAIASLLLSMLLLLAILVFAITQIGGILEKYAIEIERGLLTQEKSQVSIKKQAPISIKPEDQRIQERKPTLAESRAPIRQIKLRFQLGLSGLPPEQIHELSASLKNTQAPEGEKWRLWAYYPTENRVLEKSTFNLMLSVRRELSEHGIKEKDVEIKLIKSDTPPAGFREGEIVFYLAPLHLISTGKIK